MTEVQPGRDGIASPAAPSAPRRADRTELLPRILSAIVMAALAIGTARAGGPVFDLFWLVAAVVVLLEWQGLVGATRRFALGLLGCMVLGMAEVYGAHAQPTAAVAVLSLGAVAVLPLGDAGRRGITAVGLVYAGAIAVAMPLLRHSDLDGFAAVVWLFAVVWGTDTMAFFGGRAIGGPKLAPRLSPSKTWSGFAVGVLSGAILGLLVSPRSGCTACVLLAGLIAGALAQGGDLFESSLKRRFSAKDAGSLIPGHGGLMDRLDGFVAASVFAAAVGLWRFGPTGAGAGLLLW